MTNSQSCTAVTIVYGPPTTLTEHGGLRWHKTGMSPLAGYLYKPWDCVMERPPAFLAPLLGTNPS